MIKPYLSPFYMFACIYPIHKSLQLDEAITEAQ